jgi:hypothetical protein
MLQQPHTSWGSAAADGHVEACKLELQLNDRRADEHHGAEDDDLGPGRHG